MSHQNGLSNNGTETTRFTEPDDGDDRVQKENKNVAHARMVSNRRSSRIQDACGIRLPQVEDVGLISGDPLLVQAAIDAVKQWQYKPTLLNGAAVDVVTSVTITLKSPQ